MKTALSDDLNFKRFACRCRFEYAKIGACFEVVMLPGNTVLAFLKNTFRKLGNLLPLHIENANGQLFALLYFKLKVGIRPDRIGRDFKRSKQGFIRRVCANARCIFYRKIGRNIFVILV